MIAWLLNLDAEEELFGAGAGTGDRRSRRALVALTDPGSPDGLMEPGDVDLGAPARAITPGAAAMPWCATATARRRLASMGLRTAFAPDELAVRQANDRATFAGRGDLPGVRVCRDLDQVRDAVSRPAPPRAPGTGRAPAWLLRAAFSSAGRRRLVAEHWGPEARTFARRQLLGGALVVAPMVDIEEEFAVHGLVLGDGRVEIGRPVVQRVEGGAWRGCAPLPAESPQRRPLVDVARAVGEELRSLGFTGPFGVDAFQWRDGDGRPRLHAPSEVNARLTMGFPRSGLLPLMRGALRSEP